MHFKVVVFDFDGTLVDSASAKRKAFFSIFPDSQQHRDVISAVLADDPDGPRTTVIPRMIAELTTRGLWTELNGSESGKISEYAETAHAAVKACSELPGATDLLRGLRDRANVHLSSNTPLDALKVLVADRGWTQFFDDLHGRPARKTETLASLIRRYGVAENQVAVIGDGISDRQAAEENGCVFFPIKDRDDLISLELSWRSIGFETRENNTMILLDDARRTEIKQKSVELLL